MTLDITLAGHLDVVMAIKYINEFNYIVSSGEDYKLKIWSLKTGK